MKKCRITEMIAKLVNIIALLTYLYKHTQRLVPNAEVDVLYYDKNHYDTAVCKRINVLLFGRLRLRLRHLCV